MTLGLGLQKQHDTPYLLLVLNISLSDMIWLGNRKMMMLIYMKT
jgi:hypothetical protein